MEKLENNNYSFKLIVDKQTNILHEYTYIKQNNENKLAFFADIVFKQNGECYLSFMKTLDEFQNKGIASYSLNVLKDFLFNFYPKNKITAITGSEEGEQFLAKHGFKYSNINPAITEINNTVCKKLLKS